MKKILMIFILTIMLFPSLVLAKDYNLTIKQETENNKRGEFAYRIKSWKEETVSGNTINVGDFGSGSEVSHPLWGDCGMPYFYAYMPFLYNGYNYDKNRDYHGPVFCNLKDEFSDPNRPITQEYIALTSSLKGAVYTIDKNRKVDSVENIYNTNITINYNNKEYLLYSDFDNFEDKLSGWDYTAELFCEHGCGLYIFEEDYVQKKYLNLLPSLGKTDEEGYYTFVLKDGDNKAILIPEGYEYEIQQQTPNGWELVSINDSEEPINTSGTIDGDVTFKFLNKKIDNDSGDPTSEPEEENEILKNPLTSTYSLIILVIISIMFISLIFVNKRVIMKKKMF